MDRKALLADVRAALAEIHSLSARASRETRAEGCPSSAELQVVREELQRIERELDSDTIPAKEHRRTSIGRIAVDGSFDALYKSLGDALCRIADVYKRKL